MRTLKPWAYGPFELLLHAELHFRAMEDFDRRISLISFDNAIEVSIATYLGLHPLQRGNRQYTNADVERWLRNYHTKIDLFFGECATRNLTVIARPDEIIWFHEIRNGQYHGGGATIPQQRELAGIRTAAIEIFSVLFEETSVVQLLEEYIAAESPPPPPQQRDEYDRLIDAKYGVVEICGRPFHSSDLLFAMDPEGYRETAIELAELAAREGIAGDETP